MANDGVIGAFSEDQTATLSGLSVNQLRAWDRDAFFSPSYGSAGQGVPFSRIYSFRDIVSLRVLNDLRNNVGCSLPYLKKLSAELAHFGDAKWTSTTLYTLGKKVVVRNPGSLHGGEELVHGQHILAIPLRQVIASTRRAITRMNERTELGVIVRSKFVNRNEPVFSGTRIYLSSVTELLNAGYNSDKIIAFYPSLSAEDVRTARNYQNECQAA